MAVICVILTIFGAKYDTQDLNVQTYFERENLLPVLSSLQPAFHLH